MRLYRCVLFAVALVLAAAPSAHSLDMAKVTCRSFAASGHDNMAAVILRPFSRSAQESMELSAPFTGLA
jgi:hypothetical protein